MDKNKISTVFIPQLQLLKSVESLKNSHIPHHIEAARSWKMDDLEENNI
jgi:hypothetical protein